MTTIKQRISQLERASNHEPMLVLDVSDRPTDEQQAEIDKATRTGRRLIVFYMPEDTAWILGCGKPAPWECKEENAYGDA